MNNPEVGPFFYIKGKLIAFPDELDDGVDSGVGVIDGKAGHFDEYEKLPYRYEHDYDYWPRGRVVFDKNKGKAIVYLDRCIKKGETVKAAIIDTYHLDVKKTLWRLDTHYQCHRCNKNDLE